MARRTPGGGGSTERSPSSTRSFSSHLPPGVDDASPSQFDTAVGETTRSRNKMFCKITASMIEATAILIATEKFCEQRGITVESPADPSLLPDVEGFHNKFGRLSEITDQNEVRVLRKYVVRNKDTLGTLKYWQQPCLSQLFDALLDTCEEWESSIRSSYDAVRDLLDREMNPSSLPLSSSGLRVARLAFTAFTQSI